jgi:hypothetical protein
LFISFLFSSFFPLLSQFFFLYLLLIFFISLLPPFLYLSFSPSFFYLLIFLHILVAYSLLLLTFLLIPSCINFSLKKLSHTSVDMRLL